MEYPRQTSTALRRRERLLPLVVLGVAGALLVGLPVGIWRLVAWAIGPLLRSVNRARPTTPTPEA
jgi:hypothetical protein